MRALFILSRLCQYTVMANNKIQVLHYIIDCYYTDSFTDRNLLHDMTYEKRTNYWIICIRLCPMII